MKHTTIWDRMVDAQPTLEERHPTVGAEPRLRVMAYLRAGTRLTSSRGRDADVWTGEPNRVPRATYTDGIWVWDASLLYYVDQYGLIPDLTFLNYLNECDFTPRRPTPEELKKAKREVLRNKFSGLPKKAPQTV